MKRASDFKFDSKNALSGRWGLALITGLVASLLGGTAYGFASSGGFSFSFDFSSFENSETPVNPPATDITEALPEILTVVLIACAVICAVGLVVSAVYFVLGSIVEVGYARFNLTLVDYGEPAFRNLFDYFPHWKKVLLANFLRQLFISLWSLLFIVPGIIATYNYALVPYLMAEDPEMSAREAMNKSKIMMYGNRWRLFCLSFSFIGWELLNGLLTMGVGSLWLTPYKSAALASFYRDVSGTSAEYAMPQDQTI